MIVEELVTKLGLEVDSNVIGVLEKFKSLVTGGLGGIAIAGAGIAAAFAGIVVQAGLAADEIGDMAEKLGVSSTALQELKFAAEQSDVSFESLSTGLKFLSKNAVEAAQGSEEAQKAFAGINARNADGSFKSADDILRSVVDRFQQIPAGVKQTQLAIKLFGKSGLEMVPLLKKGNAEIDKFIKDAHELGVVLDKETIEQAGEFERQLKRVKSAFLGLRNEFAAPFFQAFGNFFEFLADTLKTLRPYIRDVSKMFADLGHRIADILSIGAMFFSWVSKFFKAADGADVWYRSLKVIEAALIGLGVIMAATAAAALVEWVVAAAPFILLAIAIGLVVDEIHNFIEGNDSLLTRLSEYGGNNPLLQFLRDLLNLLTNIGSGDAWEKFFLTGARLWGAFNRLLLDGLIAVGRAFWDNFATVGKVVLAAAFPPLAAFFAGQKLLGLAAENPGAVTGAATTAGKGIVNFANAFDEGFNGGAASPGAAAQKAEAVHLTRNAQGGNQTVHIDARGMSPEQLADEIDRRRSREKLQTLNALGG